MTIALTLLFAGCVATAGCVSPEGKRSRGGGPGADVGNRRHAVEMHEGSRPFWKTPDRIDKVAHPPLESSEQADRLSRQ